MDREGLQGISVRFLGPVSALYTAHVRFDRVMELVLQVPSTNEGPGCLVLMIFFSQFKTKANEQDEDKKKTTKKTKKKEKKKTKNRRIRR